VLAASIHHADEGDADTLVDRVLEAQANLSEAGLDTEIEEAVADKAYHATDTLERADAQNIRTYIPERKPKGKRRWKNVSAAARQAFINNRRRTRQARSKQLQRKRSERVERSFAHMCDTGGARRSWLRGIEKVQKRYLIAAVARNLGLVLRTLLALGTPRGLQAEGGVVCFVCLAWIHISGLLRRRWVDRSATEALGVACATAA
jgi:transposase